MVKRVDERVEKIKELASMAGRGDATANCAAREDGRGDAASDREQWVRELAWMRRAKLGGVRRTPW